MATSQDASSPSYRRRRVCSILGCFFIVLPTCQKWIWGNLTVYVSSYLYAQGGHDATEVNTPWMVPTYSIAWPLGVFLYVPLHKYTGRTMTLLIGIFLNDTGILMAYLSVRLNSIPGLNLTLGFISGVGDGTLSTVIILIAAEWAGKHQGLMNSIVFSSHNLAALPFNLFATWYINPLNLSPRLSVGSSIFFTESSVLDKVPMVILFFLYFSLMFQILGGILVWHEMFHIAAIKINENLKSCIRYRHCTTRCMEMLQNSSENEYSLEKTWSKTEQFKEEKYDCIMSGNEKSELGQVNREDSKRETLDVDDEHTMPSDSKEISDGSLSPRQVVRTPSFYALLLCFGIADYATVWILTYYKIFGLRYLPDDYFLTDVGTAMALLSAVSRFFWGWSLDYLGIKTTMILCSSSLSISTSLFFFTPLGGQWAYAFATLFVSFLVSGYIIIVSIATLRWYGTRHFGANYGLAFLATTFTELTAPLFYQSFLEHLGWFPLLISISALNALAILVIIPVVPRQAPDLLMGREKER